LRSFNELMIDSPVQQRRRLPSLPSPKPEILVRSSEEAAFNFTWDDHGGTVADNEQTEVPEDYYEDDQTSERQPDIVVDAKRIEFEIVCRS